MPETAADVVLKGISLPLPLLLKSGVMSSGFISHAGRTAGRDSAGCLLPEGGTIARDPPLTARRVYRSCPAVLPRVPPGRLHGFASGVVLSCYTAYSPLSYLTHERPRHGALEISFLSQFFYYQFFNW